MIKFSRKSEELLDEARVIAENLGHSFIGTEHLLLAFFSKNDTKELFLTINPAMINIMYSELLSVIVSKRGRGELTSLSSKNFSKNAKRAIEKSYILAFSKKDIEISPRHIAAILSAERNTMASEIMLSLKNGAKKEIRINNFQSVSYKENFELIKRTISLTPILNTYSKDLTELAFDDKLDPIIGRESETQRVIQILLRKNKNNPCLIGSPGVGKSAIAEGLAIKIVNGNVPSELLSKRVVSLDVASLVSGAKYRGDFEERVKNVFSEIKKAGNIILVIDEVHNIVNTGSGEGAIDAANILKPELARGEVSIIGATTLEEYRNYIEKDGALDRRFQKVFVNEPTKKETFEIIRGLRERYEKYHNIKIDDEAIERAVEISIKNMPDKFLPDKAIDLIDEGASMIKINGGKTLSSHDIEEVYKRTRKGRTLLEIKERVNFNKVSKNIKISIIGQDNAVDRALIAIKNFDGAVGACMMFVGSTGCGKTSLAKLISHEIFGENSILKLDMSEYSERHTISKLIGSPPGYVGYEDKGILFDAMVENPSRVILFDEFDKAHADVQQLLLNILDDGVLRDTRGKIVSFKEAVIIFTSSAGFEKNVKESGFLRSDSKSTDSLRNVLGNELYARIDEVIVFDKPSVEEAIYLCENLSDNLSQNDLRVLVTHKVIEKIVKMSDVKNLGLRNVKKIFKKEVENKLKEHLYTNPECSGTIRVDLDNNGNIYILSDFSEVDIEKNELLMYNIKKEFRERKYIDA